MKEEWREVAGNPRYMVSNTGRVCRTDPFRILNPSINKRGYKSINLYNNGSRTTKRVHRLVAEAFIPNKIESLQVNHKDGNKLNNNANNLEWTTAKDNCKHAWNSGLVSPSYGMLGKKNPNGGRKGKPFRIIETGEIFNTAMECANKINGNHRHINDCLLGRQTTHRGYHFEYL